MRMRFQSKKEASMGFTLIEVLLASVIAAGLLVVALHFYSQAASVRGQLLAESERVAAIRQVMERMTVDLRAAFAQPQYGFTGDSSSMEFVTVETPLPGAWSLGSSSQPEPGRTDLKLVTYGLSRSLQGSNQVPSGIYRRTGPLVELLSAAGQPRTEKIVETTNMVIRPSPKPLTESIRHLRLWYWDGYGWSDTWSSDLLPRAVEITLGGEPLAEELTPAEYDGEIYRRIVYLPCSTEIEQELESTNAAPVFASATIE